MKATREDMLHDIKAEVRYTRELIGREALDERVMQAMGEVPREKFVPPNMKGAAFENGPLPIGHGQTISQPYIVALMTDLLEPEAGHSILEIGTGCGYQTAILSRLCATVYTVEVVRDLGVAAAERLQALGYHNIEFLVGNGYVGWPEHAPYDGIIVTAAASHIPPALVGQLKPGGRLVIPVGEPYGYQNLMLVEKVARDDVRTRTILGVAFVPLVETGLPGEV
jgi:protein-L-isoaspartate(D-aspartate) O-methyltransferase